jgi:hypothetical protein
VPVTEPAHYALDADPADNPNQPDPAVQAIHHPGAKLHAARETSRLKATPPAALAGGLTAGGQTYGDVWFDYSSARPSDAALRGAKAKGVCRYASPLNADGSYYGPTREKMITPDEYRWHLGNGRGCYINYEWYEGRMSEAGPAGRQDAYWAGRIAAACGYPAGGLIPFSDDTDSTPYESVVTYLRAAEAQLQTMPGKYHAGIYGRQAHIARLAKDVRIPWPILLWQTCAWSGGVYGGTGHLYQAICAPVSPTLPGCDTNFRMRPDPGATGDDMSAEDVTAIVAAVNKHTDAKLATLRDDLLAGLDHRVVREWLFATTGKPNALFAPNYAIPASAPFGKLEHGFAGLFEEGSTNLADLGAKVDRLGEPPETPPA